MTSQRSFIESSLAQISERLGQLPMLRGSEQAEEIERVDGLIGSAENEIGKFLSLISKKEGEVFEERLNGLRVRLEELKAPKEVRPSNTSLLMPKKSTGKFLQVAAKEGDRLISEQKNATKRIIGVISQMNEEINVIEKEIWVQREKLAMTRDRISESQAFLLQTKRAMSFFAKTLYQDILIKVLIGVIVLAIIAIFVSSALYSRKKNIITNEISRQKEEYRAIDYTEMDDAPFKNAFFETKAELPGKSAEEEDGDDPTARGGRGPAKSSEIDDHLEVPTEEKVSTEGKPSEGVKAFTEEKVSTEENALDEQNAGAEERKEIQSEVEAQNIPKGINEVKIQPRKDDESNLSLQKSENPEDPEDLLREEGAKEKEVEGNLQNSFSSSLQQELDDSNSQNQQQESGLLAKKKLDDGEIIPGENKI